MNIPGTTNLHCEHILHYYRHRRASALAAYQKCHASGHTHTAQIFADDYDFYHSAALLLMHMDHWKGLIMRLKGSNPDLYISYNVRVF